MSAIGRKRTYVINKNPANMTGLSINAGGGNYLLRKHR